MMLSLGERKRVNGIYVVMRTRLMDVYVWEFSCEPEQTRFNEMASFCSFNPAAHQLCVCASKKEFLWRSLVDVNVSRSLFSRIGRRFEVPTWTHKDFSFLWISTADTAMYRTALSWLHPRREHNVTFYSVYDSGKPCRT